MSKKVRTTVLACWWFRYANRPWYSAKTWSLVTVVGTTEMKGSGERADRRHHALSDFNVITSIRAARDTAALAVGRPR